jgi:hypothetical protein
MAQISKKPHVAADHLAQTQRIISNKVGLSFKFTPYVAADGLAPASKNPTQKYSTIMHTQKE